MLKGALHLHSYFSDGEFTIAELRALFQQARCSFALITDHADSFDDAKVARYVAECERNSDDTFLFIPSLEYSCEHRIHVLGYGVTALCESTNPEDVFEHIRRNGGKAVIAHPRDDMLDWIQSLRVLPDGIEAWNTKYDGKFAPRAQVFSLIARLRRKEPRLNAYYGLDLHWRKQYRAMFTVISTNELSRSSILTALTTGSFHGLKDGIELSSSGDLPEHLVRRYRRIHSRSKKFKAFSRGLNSVLKSMHVPIPTGVKSQLRRLF